VLTISTADPLARDRKFMRAVTATCDAAGWYHGSFRVYRNSLVKMAFSGDTTFAASESTPTLVACRAWANAPMAARVVPAGSLMLFRGRVGPKGKGSTHVELQMKTRTGWARAIRSGVRVKQDSTGVSWSLVWRAVFVGRWRVAVHRADPRHAEGVSRWTVFQVGPSIAAGVRNGPFVFPVAGPHNFANDWGAPRTGHSHQGNDIFAARGTPVVACVPGTVKTKTGGSAGKSIWLKGPNGADWFYAHLNAYAVRSGAKVRIGDVIGYVGNTGNASGGVCHLHFGLDVGGWNNPNRVLVVADRPWRATTPRR
jgi:murein DD-endopeptidase MepM/ murein hydrolase activator NlpD